VAVQRVQWFTGKIQGLLQMRGSPPYTHSREAGEGVASSYMQALLASIRSLIPGLASTIGGVASTLMAQPMGLATAAVPSVGAYAAGAAGSVSAGTSTVNNTWQLVVNGVPYTFETRDDFINALDDLSAFNGDGRLQ